MKIDVALLPLNVPLIDLTERVCVVLDVFRATTSIITAIGNGCQGIIPVASLEAAQEVAKTQAQALFAGERQSIKIKGFDFGNSPLEFTAKSVHNKTIIMSTSNGTSAIESTNKATATFIGAFINATAVCQQACKYQKDIVIVCAGTDRLFSLEDALCAGLLVEHLQKMATCELSDAARGVALMYQSVQANLATVVAESRNGKRLLDLGYEQDFKYCLQKDLLEVVPQYRDGKITALKG